MATLAQLHPGQSGEIEALAVGGALKRRLADMGLTPGVRITVRRTAPLGDPICLSLRGYELSLRRSEADAIRIAPGKGKPPRAASRRETPPPTDTAVRMPPVPAREKRPALPPHSSQTALRMPSASSPGPSRPAPRPPAGAPAQTGPLRIALAGNPNCGKTTLFNALTGSRQYVGNWPGVTVQKKSAPTKSGESELVDLPGIYSLSPYSMEEVVARDYLMGKGPRAVIDIVDGTNLERNLYLTLQLLELGLPMVVAVNMMDEVEQKGWTIDLAALSAELGVPVLPVTAWTGRGVGELLACAERLAREGTPPPEPDYPGPVQSALCSLRAVVGERERAAFYAAKLLEGDREAAGWLDLDAGQRREADRIVRLFERDCAERSPAARPDPETLLADARYRRIEAVAAACQRKPGAGKRTLTDCIDAVAAGRFTALPVFLLLLGSVFALTFGPVGKFLSGLVERFFAGFLAPALTLVLDLAKAPGWCRGMLLDGVLGGVSGVLVFLPQIALLFLCLSLLEDSGYLARAAFLMDRPLHKIGLTGKSFIPMLLGFGCTTPAVMAARGLENERDRRMTMMLTPFMSCSARLPIFAMFAGAFFPRRQGAVVLSLYLLGVLVAIGCGFLLRKTLFRGKPAPFVLELPPYRLPLPSAVLRHVWEKVRGFLVKAGTLIFAMSVLLWAAQAVTPALEAASAPAESLLGLFGKWLAPLFTPLGFGTWQAAVALLTGLVAKESVVGSLTILYAGGSAAALPTALAAVFTPASAVSFLVFSLLYMPCISAFATLVKEMDSVKWAVGTALLQGGAAYAGAFLAYRLAGLIL